MGRVATGALDAPDPQSRLFRRVLGQLKESFRFLDCIRVEADHLVPDPLVELFKAPLQRHDFIRTEHLGGRVRRTESAGIARHDTDKLRR